MLPNYLLPETVVHESGIGPHLEIENATSVLLTLGITRIIEQESLQISIWGSRDGNDWGSAPLLVFPQKFYCGTYTLLVDLSERSGIRYLRAQWDVHLWSRGNSTPLFGFYLIAQPSTVPATAEAFA